VILPQSFSVKNIQVEPNTNKNFKSSGPYELSFLTDNLTRKQEQLFFSSVVEQKLRIVKL
jgi:hypothetical protein